MARLIEINFKIGDIIKHKRKSKRYILYSRHKNTCFLKEHTREDINKYQYKKVKANTLNYCFELDKAYMVLYGQKEI